MFSHLPHLHFRQTISVIGHVTFTGLFAGLARYVDELRKSINLDIIYNREIKGRDIYISNGYASLYFLLEGLKGTSPNTPSLSIRT